MPFFCVQLSCEVPFTVSSSVRLTYVMQFTSLPITNFSLASSVSTDLTSLSLEDVDSVSEADRDTLAPLPPPSWNNQYPYSSSSYLPQNLSYIPPYSYTSADNTSFVGSYVDGVPPGMTIPGSAAAGGNGSAGSAHSASGELHQKLEIVLRVWSQFVGSICLSVYILPLSFTALFAWLVLVMLVSQSAAGI